MPGDFLNEERSSLIMSDELYENIDLDDEAKELVKKRTKLTVLRFRIDEEKEDILLTILRAVGFNPEENTTTVEVSLAEDSAIDFLLGIRSQRLSLFAIEVHQENNVINIFKQTKNPLKIHRCNIYDVSVQSEEATLVLVLSNDVEDPI